MKCIFTNIFVKHVSICKLTVLSLFCSLHKEDQSEDQNHIDFSPLEVTFDPLPEEGHPHGPRRSPQCEVPLGRDHLC